MACRPARFPLTIRTYLILVVLLVTGCANAGATSTSESTPIGAGLSGPRGLVASTYAIGVPDVSAFAIDADGRLWAATAGYSDDGDDGVYLIDSAGATPLEVIDGLATPLGLVWTADVLYVASKGRVDAYRGFDGRNFATRTTVVSLSDGVGQVNGLAQSPDGRLMLGISAPCDACTTAIDETAAIISFLPDGSDRQIEASEIRAPVGLAFYPGTADLFVTMYQRDDLGDATPGDWLAQVRSGQAWGFPDCYGQGGDGCAGVPAPVGSWTSTPRSAASRSSPMSSGPHSAPRRSSPNGRPVTSCVSG